MIFRIYIPFDITQPIEDSFPFRQPSMLGKGMDCLEAASSPAEVDWSAAIPVFWGDARIWRGWWLHGPLRISQDVVIGYWMGLLPSKIKKYGNTADNI